MFPEIFHYIIIFNKLSWGKHGVVDIIILNKTILLRNLIENPENLKVLMLLLTA